jgi:hypothetical protein
VSFAVYLERVPSTSTLEHSPMPLTIPKALGALLACAALSAVGLALLYGALDTWNSQQFLLSRRRVVPRLVSFAANPTEFVLRCLFMASIGAALFSFALAVLVGLVHRLVATGSRFFAGPFESRIAVRLLFVPLACFIVWFVLLGFLPFYYD